MRQRVGTWGAELSDDDFACALAAAGIQPPQPDGRAGWIWSGVPSRTARELADEWKHRVQGQPLRVGIDPKTPDAWPWLAREVVGIHGLAIAPLHVVDTPAPERWTWPWQVVDLTAGTRLRALLESSSWKRITLQPIDADERTPAGLLLLDGALPAGHTRQKAQFLFATEAVDPAAIAKRVGASIVMVGGPKDPKVLVELIEETSVELSHNIAIDQALLVAARRLKIEPPALYADLDIADRARMANRATLLVDRLVKLRLVPNTSFTGFESTRGPLNTLVQRLDWGGEGRGATVVAALEREQRDRETSSANKMPPRYLQGWLVKEGDSEKATAVASGANYDVNVQIGEFDATLLQVLNPIKEPYDGVDAEIDVIVSDRQLLPTPLRGKLLLPANGSSKPATFRVAMKPGVASLELRVTVLHRNRVLQSGIIRAKIDGKDPLRFELDAIGRHHLAGLENRREFDAAIVANHATTGEATFVGAVPDNVGYIALAPKTLDDLTVELGRSIAKIAVDPPKYRNLRDPGTIDILRDLAARGSAFFDVLTQHNEIGKDLVNAERIQVVAAREGTFLPLELAYSHPPPDDDKVGLCDHAEDALKTGACPSTCGPSGKHICPLGFWSLAKVIERQTHRPEHTQLAQRTDYELVGLALAATKQAPAPANPADDEAPSTYNEPVTRERELIQPAKTVIVAASNRIDEVARDTSQILRDALTTTFGTGNVISASDWTQWVSGITAAQHPSLLVLLPHHVEGAANDGVLEIGDKQTLRALYVRSKHVLGENNAPPPPEPIVLLLGCATQIASIPYESFVSVFRKYKAKIVVSTIATVLGRDAAPVAASLASAIQELHAHGGGFIGDAMLALRRNMLLAGKTMVLALTAYGDADCRLAPNPV